VRNPLRILDCKVPSCGEIVKNAPVITDFVCEDCKNHTDKLCSLLKACNIPFKVNPQIVRGLDYYTKTVFEFVSGSVGTVCGGGRYNNLVESIGGKSTPCVGFGMGIERLLYVLESDGVVIENNDHPEVFVISQNQDYTEYCISLADKLRANAIACETEYTGRSMKAQFKFADKQKAEYVIVIGGSEIENGECEVKKQSDGTRTKVRIDDLVKFFKEN
jgi:histidyl-tRNA synthetase